MRPLFNNTADDLLYWHTQKKRLIRGKMNSYEGLHEKNLSPLVTTCRQLSKLHFPPKKMSDFLILYRGGAGRLTRTEQLTDCDPTVIPIIYRYHKYLSNPSVLLLLLFYC